MRSPQRQRPRDARRDVGTPHRRRQTAHATRHHAPRRGVSPAKKKKEKPKRARPQLRTIVVYNSIIPNTSGATHAQATLNVQYRLPYHRTLRDEIPRPAKSCASLRSAQSHSSMPQTKSMSKTAATAQGRTHNSRRTEGEREEELITVVAGRKRRAAVAAACRHASPHEVEDECGREEHSAEDRRRGDGGVVTVGELGRLGQHRSERPH
jgi:hypothetical protein